MKIKFAIFYLGVAVLTSGCMSPYAPLKISTSHPASNQAEDAPVYEASTTLDQQEVNEKNRNNKKESNSHQQDEIKPMKCSGGMKNDMR